MIFDATFNPLVQRCGKSRRRDRFRSSGHFIHRLTGPIVKKIVLAAHAGLLADAFFGDFALANDAHWTCSGAGGPNEWGALAPEYSACVGKNWSPGRDETSQFRVEQAAAFVDVIQQPNSRPMQMINAMGVLE
jgi:carbonic anhydrase